MTRAQNRAAFLHVLNTILDQDAQDPLALALADAAMSTITSLITLPKSSIDALMFERPLEGSDPPVTERVALQIGNKNLIHWFTRWSYALFHANTRFPLTHDEWLETKVDDFDEFRTSNGTSMGPIPIMAPTAPTTTSTAGPAAARVTESAATLFKKGIKRDASVYPTLKEQSHFNNWNRSVIAQARAHDSSEVFDLNYSPTTAEDIELFTQKQSFAYSVLNRCLLTDQGKAFVREHEADYDAQAVYIKLIAHAKVSTSAELTKDQLIEFLTSTKLDSHWRGTTEGFVLHWREQMRLLEDLSPPSERYSSGIKKRMLSSAVKLIPELANIKNIDNNMATSSGRALDYNQYYDLLLSAAVQRDDTIHVPSSRTKQAVHYSDSCYDR